MPTRAWPGFAFGAAWGFAIFALSLPLGGHVEPWDGLPGYYPIALVLGGLLAGIFLRARPLPLWLGLMVGKVFYVCVCSSRGPGNLWPIGLAFDAVASLLALVGFWVGVWLARRMVA